MLTSESESESESERESERENSGSLKRNRKDSIAVLPRKQRRRLDKEELREEEKLLVAIREAASRNRLLYYAHGGRKKIRWREAHQILGRSNPDFKRVLDTYYNASASAPYKQLSNKLNEIDRKSRDSEKQQQQATTERIGPSRRWFSTEEDRLLRSIFSNPTERAQVMSGNAYDWKLVKNKVESELGILDNGRDPSSYRGYFWKFIWWDDAKDAALLKIPQNASDRQWSTALVKGPLVGVTVSDMKTRYAFLKSNRRERGPRLRQGEPKGAHAYSKIPFAKDFVIKARYSAHEKKILVENNLVQFLTWRASEVQKHCELDEKYSTLDRKLCSLYDPLMERKLSAATNMERFSISARAWLLDQLRLCLYDSIDTPLCNADIGFIFKYMKLYFV